MSKKPYTPSKQILEKYADVLVNFALNSGKGIKKGEVIRLSVQEVAKPLFNEIYKAIVTSGGHVLVNYIPDDSRDGIGRAFFDLAQPHQLSFFPEKHIKGLVETIDHSISIISDIDPFVYRGVDPKKLMQRGVAMKPYRDWLDLKENKGKFTWVAALYGTPAMAKEAGLSEKEYWQQIIKACFLDAKNPIKEWQKVFKQLEGFKRKMNALAPKTDKLHVKGVDVDLWITLGEKRQWLAGSGRNIPSFELFTSPDWRGTNGWIRFNQPLYRYGDKITGIQLWFKNGKVVKSSAKTNEKLLKQMIATPGADKIGEYSLTDRRLSRITKFMAETLYDENVGGPQGNTHLALGKPYEESYTGNVAKLTRAESKRLGFNDSSVHTDIISTTRRTVTAHLKDGSTKVIYKDGEFVL